MIREKKRAKGASWRTSRASPMGISAASNPDKAKMIRRTALNHSLGPGPAVRWSTPPRRARVVQQHQPSHDENQQRYYLCRRKKAAQAGSGLYSENIDRS